MALELLITHSSVIQLCYLAFPLVLAIFIFYSLVVFIPCCICGILTIDVIRQYLIGLAMINGFKCKKTELLFNGGRVAAFSGFKAAGRKKRPV